MGGIGRGKWCAYILIVNASVNFNILHFNHATSRAKCLWKIAVSHFSIMPMRTKGIKTYVFSQTMFSQSQDKCLLKSCFFFSPYNNSFKNLFILHTYHSLPSVLFSHSLPPSSLLASSIHPFSPVISQKGTGPPTDFSKVWGIKTPQNQASLPVFGLDKAIQLYCEAPKRQSKHHEALFPLLESHI